MSTRLANNDDRPSTITESTAINVSVEGPAPNPLPERLKNLKPSAAYWKLKKQLEDAGLIRPRKKPTADEPPKNADPAPGDPPPSETP